MLYFFLNHTRILTKISVADLLKYLQTNNVKHMVDVKVLKMSTNNCPNALICLKYFIHTHKSLQTDALYCLQRDAL